MDDDKGTSLIFVNSFKGKDMLRKIIDKILYEEVDIQQAVSFNSAATKPVVKNPNRNAFFKELDQLSFDKLVDKYCKDAILTKVKSKIKSVLRVAFKKWNQMD